MKLFWTHIYRWRRYREGTATERRMIELRYSVARALRARRKRLRITQKQLAEIMGADQATISRVERASLEVTFDQVIWAMLALGMSDEEIANAVNAGARPDVQQLRRHMGRRLETKPVPGFRLGDGRR